MKWIRYEEGFKPIYTGMGITLVFFLFALIYSLILPAACFAAVFAMFSFQNIYYSKVGKDLKLLPTRSRSRFLIGTVNEVLFEFENGKIPIWNGTLTLSIEDSVLPVVDNHHHFSGIFDFSVPFAIGSGEKVRISIPLEGRKRGLSRITRMTIEVPHIFGEGSVLMELAEPIKQESLVYPKITPLIGKLQPSPFRPGEVDQRHSLFHDKFQPVGTRDYVPTDRFDQIHWTASARMQKLQTKEYLPVTEQSILFVMNAIEKPRSPQDFDLKIERLASYADYCTRNAIPFSVVINIHTFGATPYMYLPTGIGKTQYQKTLEMLAVLSDKNAKLPFENVLQKVESKGVLPPTIVLITHEPERYSPFVKRWSKHNTVELDCFYEGAAINGSGTD
ncbi:DUF58 domain-containing protein [Sporosarcina sp. ANT_H38]|uniref:DUF58 domain-containing protein n=1 Tax=Sporosarcina sp. ANT_H38 TaxID=2597358 RepID=UPI0011F30ACC|nr:DUF58 domain-containing protein [Sporosarcina sp. ANT_H38]KAA0966680.1 DUF58 domain-containing protein [Sporosarcina sp. ANT_H38]